MAKKPTETPEYIPSPLNAIAKVQESLPDAEFGIHGDGVHIAVNGKTAKLSIKPDLAEIDAAVEALKAE